MAMGYPPLHVAITFIIVALPCHTSGDIQLLGKEEQQSKSPTHEQQSNLLKLFLRQPFCENVGLLLERADVLSHNALGLSNLLTEEVILELEIFVARGHLGDID